MTVLSVCVLTLLPQIFDRSGRITLPKPQQPPPQQVQQAPADETVERFRRLLFDLRRSAGLSQTAEELKLSEIAESIPDPGGLARQLLPRAEQELMHGLMRVLARYGDPDVAKDIQYVLLTRPVGSVTQLAMQTMAGLSREDAKERLFECLTARFGAVRTAAGDLLALRIVEADLPRLLELAESPDVEVERKALELMAIVPGESARARLVRALASASTGTGAVACRSLLAHGPVAAPALQQIVSMPAVGRNFGYASLLLVQFEDQTGQVFLTPAMQPHLLRELDGLDPFLQVTSALALANLAFRSDDRGGQAFADARIVDALLLIAAPRQFVPNGSLLDAVAQQKLVQFTGADHRGRALAWLKWWEAAKEGFVGNRMRIRLDASNATVAWLEWRDPAKIVRVRGEKAPAAPADPREIRPVWELWATGAEFAALVSKLEEQGFMTPGILAAAATAELLPVERELVLNHGSSRARVAGPRTTTRWLDVLQTEIGAFADKEKWQLFLPAGDERARLAAWHAEREWLAQHPDRIERDCRLKDAILAGLPGFSASVRDLALQVLLAFPDPGSVFTAADGARLAEMVRERGSIDAAGQQMLEAAILAPGDAWLRAVDVVVALHDRGGSAALPALFALLGADKVLAAARTGEPATRRAAMRELANLKDLRATPLLLAALEEEPLAETAVFALGRIGDPAARDPLLAMANRPGLLPTTRRALWVALARIGGEQVVPVLQQALSYPEFLDRQAALQAMGEMRDAGIAAFLAQVFATWGTDALGSQALISLQKQGALLARPALRRFLDSPDARVRREIVFALAEFQDPAVVPDLISMLDSPPDSARAAMLLAATTGIDVMQGNDRQAAMREWWKNHKDLPQAVWFLTALRAEKIETTLAPDQLAPGAGIAAVKELTGIMVRANQPHLRVLAAAMLRQTTAQDFGLVTARTPVAQLQAIADRYQFFAEAEGGRR